MKKDLNKRKESRVGCGKRKNDKEKNKKREKPKKR